MLQQGWGTSQRRACRAIGQARSTQRYRPPQPHVDAALRAWLREFSIAANVDTSASSTVPADRRTAERPNQVWALDFQFDTTADWRLFKILNIVDEHTRETLACRVARSIDADATVNALDTIAAHHGYPALLCCDIGPELTAHALRDWCRISSTRTAFIDPGEALAEPLRRVVSTSPRSVRRLNSRLRDEMLAVE